MTTIETRSLDPGDLVACGSHIGRVIRTAPYTVTIEWQPCQATIHHRDQMGMVHRVTTTVVHHSDTLDAIRRAEHDEC